MPVLLEYAAINQFVSIRASGMNVLFQSLKLPFCLLLALLLLLGFLPRLFADGSYPD